MIAPALRFKNEDGQDFPDWKVKPISELAIKVIDGDRGQNYPNGNDFSDDGYCLFLNAKNVTKSGFAFEELSFITKEKDEQLRKGKLSKNDLIITTRGSVGNIAHFDDEVKYVNMRINSGMVILRNESTDISPNYLYQYFYSPKFTKSVQKIAFGSAQPQLTVLEIKKFIVGLPLINEQTKIANFLTAVDEKITQLTQKCDMLAQYKKGVMQQIFSQELRFKDDDGRDFPEWDETTLGDVCKPQQWKTIAASELTEFGYPAYGANGQIGFYSNYNHEDETVAVTCRGATCGEVSLIPPKSYITGNAMSLDEINPEDNNHRYVYYALILRGFRDVISGSAQPQIVGSAIRKVEFAKPTIKEQTKIANFLTAIDDKITNSQTQLQAVKQYKQGLLQQMFV